MPESLAYRVYKLYWRSLDWIYPPKCAGCGRVGSAWCAECEHGAIPTGRMRCPICGVPQITKQICYQCKASHPHYTALHSWALYQGKVRQAIHQLKYKRNISLGMALSIPMIKQLENLDWSFDMIISVPLSLARLAERGYNQSSLLARPIAYYFRSPFIPQALRRHKDTPSQVAVSFSSREENVKGAFLAEHEIVRDKTILLIDDVITSGATMNSCATALKQADAREVYGLSFARAGLYDRQDSIMIN